MLKTIAAVVGGVLLIGVGSASAQVIAWDDKIFVNLSGAGGGGSQDFTRQFRISPYFQGDNEDAIIDTTQTLKTGGGFFDLTAGAKVIGNWAAGISFSKRSSNSDAGFAGTVPDPIAFDAPRTVSGTLAGMQHRETWFAMLGVYMLPMTDKIDLMVMAGPVAARVKHDVVTSLAISEGSGGPQVSIGREAISKTFWGIQAGIDVRYMLRDISTVGLKIGLGVGGFLRYSGASGNLTDEVKLDLGGFQVGGGLRIRY